MDYNTTPENRQPSTRTPDDPTMQEPIAAEETDSIPQADSTPSVTAPKTPARPMKSTIPHSGTVIQTRTPAANRAISSGIPSRSAHRPAPTAPAPTPSAQSAPVQAPTSAASDTLILDRTALNRHVPPERKPSENTSTTIIDRKQLAEKMAASAAVKAVKENAAETRKTPSQKAESPLLAWLPKNNNWKSACICAVAALLAICIILPITLAAKQNLEPDFAMADGADKSAVLLTPLPDTAIVGVPGYSSAASRKFLVTLSFFDQESIRVSTGAITLEKLLDEIGYTVRASDRFSCTMDTQLTEDSLLNVDTVTYQTVSEYESIPYEAKEVQVQTIPRGTRKITQYGENGKKRLTYSVEIVNGTEVGRTLVSETVETQPVNEISYLGIGGSLVGNDGKTYTYSYYRVVNATYYNLRGLTYLGYEADESVIAVDPDYIPLGTKVYVKNDKYDFGVRVAADTGGMIDEWEVDIWIGDDNPQLAAFAYTGYHYDMRIYYLD